MNNRRARLIIRRTIICFVLAGILYSIGLCAAAAVKEIGYLIAQSAPQKQSKVELSSAESMRTDSIPAKPPLSLPGSSQPEESAVSSQPKQNVPVGEFDNAVFIGDSRTEGLRNYDGLGNATYYAVKGLMVNTIFTKPAITLDNSKVTVMQAMKQKKYNKVFIMLGVNELGWSSTATFIQDYGKAIDEIKKDQPDAEIYVQSILPVTAKKSGSDKVYNNKNINYYNQQLKAMAAKKGVHFLKVDSAVSDAAGNLPENASTDGVHLNNEYCKKWCEYLKACI